MREGIITGIRAAKRKTGYRNYLSVARRGGHKRRRRTAVIYRYRFGTDHAVERGAESVERSASRAVVLLVADRNTVYGKGFGGNIGGRGRNGRSQHIVAGIGTGDRKAGDRYHLADTDVFIGKRNTG